MPEYIIIGLAAWRLAHMLVKEAGPFDIFVRLRHLVGISQIVIQDERGTDIAWTAANTFAEGLMCIWCVSVWTAALLSLSSLLPVVGIAFMWLNRILALSAGAIIVQEVLAVIRGSE